MSHQTARLLAMRHSTALTPATKHAIHILQVLRVPCAVWFEDAVARYGVPTALFKLSVLVPDHNMAVVPLEMCGWTRIAQERGRP